MRASHELGEIEGQAGCRAGAVRAGYSARAVVRPLSCRRLRPRVPPDGAGDRQPARHRPAVPVAPPSRRAGRASLRRLRLHRPRGRAGNGCGPRASGAAGVRNPNRDGGCGLHAARSHARRIPLTRPSAFLTPLV